MNKYNPSKSAGLLKRMKMYAKIIGNDKSLDKKPSANNMIISKIWELHGLSLMKLRSLKTAMMFMRLLSQQYQLVDMLL